MNYTLCDNAECSMRAECERWKNYVGKNNSSVIHETQIFIKTFIPNGDFCKYMIKGYFN